MEYYTTYLIISKEDNDFILSINYKDKTYKARINKLMFDCLDLDNYVLQESDKGITFCSNDLHILMTEEEELD